jgi:hypothetical protein
MKPGKTSAGFRSGVSKKRRLGEGTRAMSELYHGSIRHTHEGFGRLQVLNGLLAHVAAERATRRKLEREGLPMPMMFVGQVNALELGFCSACTRAS